MRLCKGQIWGAPSSLRYIILLPKGPARREGTDSAFIERKIAHSVFESGNVNLKSENVLSLDRTFPWLKADQADMNSYCAD